MSSLPNPINDGGNQIPLGLLRSEPAQESRTEGRPEAGQQRQAAKKAACLLYFARCDKYVKIGTTTNLESRLAQLRYLGGTKAPKRIKYPVEFTDD